MVNVNRKRRLEILAVVVTGLLKFILMDWLGFRLFYVVAACIFWVIYVYREYRRNPIVYKSWGFQKVWFHSSFYFLLPVALIFFTGIILYGVFNHVQILNWHIIPVFVLYPAWGVIQQFMMVGLVAGNLKKLTDVKITDSQIILFTSFLFALVHFPSIPLMGYAFFIEIIFIKVYLRWPNIWTLGLFHGWISTLFIYFVLERDLWSELWLIFS
jgi:hypothetical protein